VRANPGVIAAYLGEDDVAIGADAGEVILTPAQAGVQWQPGGPPNPGFPLPRE
jgi:hypothetical protein